jgi:hypothetical protein
LAWLSGGSHPVAFAHCVLITPDPKIPIIGVISEPVSAGPELGLRYSNPNAFSILHEFGCALFI